MGLLVAGTKYRGEFEERLKKLMEEIKQNDDIILVSALFHAICSVSPSVVYLYKDQTEEDLRNPQQGCLPSTCTQQALAAEAICLCHAVLLHLTCLCCQPQSLHICLLLLILKHVCIGLRLCSCICSFPKLDKSKLSAPISVEYTRHLR